MLLIRQVTGGPCSQICPPSKVVVVAAVAVVDDDDDVDAAGGGLATTKQNKCVAFLSSPIFLQVFFGPFLFFFSLPP